MSSSPDLIIESGVNAANRGLASDPVHYAVSEDSRWVTVSQPLGESLLDLQALKSAAPIRVNDTVAVGARTDTSPSPRSPDSVNDTVSIAACSLS